VFVAFVVFVAVAAGAYAFEMQHQQHVYRVAYEFEFFFDRHHQNTGEYAVPRDLKPFAERNYFDTETGRIRPHFRQIRDIFLHHHHLKRRFYHLLSF
jgi:hypothetical protein